MRLRLSRHAEEDLDSIWYYVATESSSIETAGRLIDTITGRFLLLAQHPYAGRSRGRDLGNAIRSFPISEYVILYSVDADAVSILRVVHGRRDLNTLFPD